METPVPRVGCLEIQALQVVSLAIVETREEGYLATNLEAFLAIPPVDYFQV